MTKSGKPRTGYAATVTTVGACLLLWIGTAWAEPDKAGQPLRLELDLVDGSRIVGTPSIEAMPLQTAYAKMTIPLKQILTLKIGEDHETVTFDLRNGDKLKGVINLEPIRLETVFGKVSVGMEHIRGLCVVLSGGALPDALRQGLVLYYSFDRDEEGKVTDESGRRHDGEVHGAKWTPKGKVGGAYRFGGNGNHIDLGANPALQPASAITVSAWIRMPPVGDNRYPIIFGYTDRTGGANGGYLLAVSRAEGSPASVATFAGLEKGGRWGDCLVAGKSHPDDDRWHCITGTYDGPTVKMYVDGVLENTGEGCHSTGITYPGGAVGSIGWDRLQNDRHYYFNGLIDEVRIYNRALSKDEVKALYEATK